MCLGLNISHLMDKSGTIENLHKEDEYLSEREEIKCKKGIWKMISNESLKKNRQFHR